jgi:hypothetical protein
VVSGRLDVDNDLKRTHRNVGFLKSYLIANIYPQIDLTAQLIYLLSTLGSLLFQSSDLEWGVFFGYCTEPEKGTSLGT